MAVDAFIKFDGLGGEGQKLGNDFDRLGDSFSDLGGAFIKLVNDASSTDTNFLKADFAEQIKHGVFTIAADFHKIGDAFIKLAGPFDTFTDGVVKLTEQIIKFTPSDSELSFPLATDFLKFDSDLKLTGLDFLSAAADIKSDTPAESLSLTFNKISQDYKAQSADALSIKGDIVALLDNSAIADSKVNEPFIKITIETVVISSAALNLSTDFQKISTDLASASDSGPMTFDQIVHKFAGDFLQLSQDLKFADTAVSGLGGDFHKLADALENPGPATTPTFKLS